MHQRHLQSTSYFNSSWTFFKAAMSSAILLIFLLYSHVAYGRVCIPLHYDIDLTLESRKHNEITDYTGMLQFSCQITNETNKFVLSDTKVLIQSVVVRTPDGTNYCVESKDGKTFNFPKSTFTKSQYEVQIKFTGTPRTDRKGLHKITYCQSGYNHSYVLAGFLDRNAFLSLPLLDETKSRATLTLTVNFPSQYDLIASGIASKR